MATEFIKAGPIRDFVNKHEKKLSRKTLEALDLKVKQILEDAIEKVRRRRKRIIFPSDLG